MAGENSFFQKALANFTHEAASGGAIRHLADMGYTVTQIKEKLDFPASYEKVRRTVWEHLMRRGVLLREEPGTGKPKERFIYVREYDKYGKVSFRRVPAEDKTPWEEKKVAIDKSPWEEKKAAIKKLSGEEKKAAIEKTPWEEKKTAIENSSWEEKKAAEEKNPKNGKELGEQLPPHWRELRIPEEMLPEKLAELLYLKTEENGTEHSYMSCTFGIIAYKDSAEYEKLLQVLEKHQRDYIAGLPWEMQTVYHRLDARMREILVKLYRTGYYHGTCYYLKTREKLEL